MPSERTQSGSTGASTGDVNVLLIVLDDIGVEWFDFHGIGTRYTTDPNFRYVRTPTLTGLVQQGVLFTESYANPICGPTRACLQVGQYGFRTGFGENIRSPFTFGTIGNRLATTLPWLPRVIEESRPGVYDTGIVGKWHLCDGYSTVITTATLPAPDLNLDHAQAAGYGYSAVHLPNNVAGYAWYRVEGGVLAPDTGFGSPPFDLVNWAPAVHQEDARAWIQSRTRPWFLHVAFNAPHEPFTVPPYATVSSETKSELEAAGLAPGASLPLSSTYAETKLIWRAAMESVDTCIGRLLDQMPPAVRANTMVIVVSDNGTVHGALPTGFLHQKRDVYRGGTQVPLIVSGPRVVAPGRSTDALAHSVDVYATILELVGARPRTGVADMDGISLVPVLENQPGSRRRVFTEVFGRWGQTRQELQVSVQRALFDGRWRYVLRNGQGELYDDHADFLEAQDVASAHPDVRRRFERELDEILGS